MPTRFKTSRKHRGQCKQGYGRRGNHLKHSSGRGNAGGEHHKRISFTKYHPGHFGKLGMRNNHRNYNMERLQNINTGCLWSLIPVEEEEKFLKAKDPNNAPVIDVTKFGYFTVTACGALPKCPIVVKARCFTKKAQEKINETGVCVLTQ